MAASEQTALGPQQFDLDRCIHCGLCLNACPTYRELGLEMDSPRGRVYQMVQVSNGAPITPSYMEHIGLCLACRGCESACPSGVRYGRMVEGARAEIEAQVKRGWLAERARHFCTTDWLRRSCWIASTVGTISTILRRYLIVICRTPRIFETGSFMSFDDYIAYCDISIIYSLSLLAQKRLTSSQVVLISLFMTWIS